MKSVNMAPISFFSSPSSLAARVGKAINVSPTEFVWL